MGVRSVEGIGRSLIDAGGPEAEPAAVVAHGTLPEQRVVAGTLADIAERAVAAELTAPAVTVVGPVAGLRETLAWIERRPLFGRSVVVTRAREQASTLARRLTGLGAAVGEAPALRILAPAGEELRRPAEGVAR